MFKFWVCSVRSRFTGLTFLDFHCQMITVRIFCIKSWAKPPKGWKQSKNCCDCCKILYDNCPKSTHEFFHFIIQGGHLTIPLLSFGHDYCLFQIKSVWDDDLWGKLIIFAWKMTVWKCSYKIFLFAFININILIFSKKKNVEK